MPCYKWEDKNSVCRKVKLQFISKQICCSSDQESFVIDYIYTNRLYIVPFSIALLVFAIKLTDFNWTITKISVSDFIYPSHVIEVIFM